MTKKSETQKLNKWLPSIPFFLSFVLKLYVTGLVIFGLLRLVLLLFTADESIRLLNLLTLKSFLIGVQFDTVVLSYLLIIPVLILYVISTINVTKKIPGIIVTLIICVVFPILIFISIADIPYFKFFHNRLSESSLQWLGNIDIVLKMVYGNSTNLFFLILSVIATVLSGILLFRFCKKQLINRKWDNYYGKKIIKKNSILFIVLLFLCFLGMRGTISHPIRQGDAFYCNNPLLNQIGLNPAFTLMKSYFSKVNLMDNKQAIKNTRQILHVVAPENSVSPVARDVINGTVMRKHNVILVIMESMSANYMRTFGNIKKLTPTLDSLVNLSWFFSNAYSAGIHTNNGVFSSLFSFPALKRIRPMSTIPVRTFSGLPYILRQNGYKNLFFSTHSESFDNLGTFIPNNFFDELYTAEDYPQDKIIGPYGVPDDYLFEYAIEKFNRFDTCQPFFGTILTASNHEPYIIPDYFKSDISEKDLKAVSYADWSVKCFLQNAEKKKWFDNTIFVFVADHGLNIGTNPYDLPLSYHHIPLIFYAPKILATPKVLDNFIGQIDIFPTVLGILGASYVNNTLGLDGINEKRDCIYFSADDKIGCINSEWLYIYRYGGDEGLYRYKTGNTKNYASEKKEEFNKLRNYALSQIQATEWIISNDKTSLLKKK